MSDIAGGAASDHCVWCGTPGCPGYGCQLAPAGWRPFVPDAGARALAALIGEEESAELVDT